jgi:hypothetical protein
VSFFVVRRRWPWLLRYGWTAGVLAISCQSTVTAVAPPHTVVSLPVYPILGKFTSLLSALSSSTCSSVQLVYGARERPIAASPACSAVRAGGAAVRVCSVGGRSCAVDLRMNGSD